MSTKPAKTKPKRRRYGVREFDAKCIELAEWKKIAQSRLDEIERQKADKWKAVDMAERLSGQLQHQVSSNRELRQTLAARNIYLMGRYD